MPSGLKTIEELIVTEDWELARQIIQEAPEFEESRREIEARFGIAIGDLDSIIHLPEDSYRRLGKLLLETIEARLELIRDELHRKICEEFDYCRQKKKLGWRVMEYISGVLDIFFTKGGLTLAVLVIKNEFLDKLCRCKK